MIARCAAIITMVLIGTAAAAQQAPEPQAHDTKAVDARPAEAKPADVKPVEGKAPEAKAPEVRRGPSASPLQTAAAIEQILRKLKEGAPASSADRRGFSSRPTARPRLRLAWRLSLDWPAALIAPPEP